MHLSDRLAAVVFKIDLDLIGGEGAAFLLNCWILSQYDSGLDGIIDCFLPSGFERWWACNDHIFLSGNNLNLVFFVITSLDTLAGKSNVPMLDGDIPGVCKNTSLRIHA